MNALKSRSDFSFDEASHSYTLGGQKLPGVTEVLDFLIPSFAKNDQAALRGRLIHRACHLLALGTLDWSSIDPRILGYVLGYQKFLDDTHFEFEEVEAMHFHKDYHYAGTLDALGKWGKDRFLFDIKTGSPARYHALQTAAYAGFFPGLIKRATLLLSDDGRYNLRFHNDRTDWNMFISALNVWRLREAA